MLPALCCMLCLLRPPARPLQMKSMDAEASLLVGLSREAIKGKPILSLLKPLGTHCRGASAAVHDWRRELQCGSRCMRL